MALEVFKEISNKMNLKTRKEDSSNLYFSTDFGLFYHFGKLEKTCFQKLIDSSIH
jgi:hypothetical protein